MADEANEFLFAPQAVGENCGLPDFQPFDAETQERLQALLQAAGKLTIALDISNRPLSNVASLPFSRNQQNSL